MFIQKDAGDDVTIHNAREELGIDEIGKSWVVLSRTYMMFRQGRRQVTELWY